MQNEFLIKERKNKMELQTYLLKQLKDQGQHFLTKYWNVNLNLKWDKAIIIKKTL